jgi:hypothetical protein
LKWLDLRITQQPLDGFAAVGTPITLSVTAEDAEEWSGLPAYQWYKDGQPLSNGGRISGADAATLQISSFEITDKGSYHCKVRNRCSDLDSHGATIEPAKELYAILVGNGNTGGIHGDSDALAVEAALLRFPGVKAQNILVVNSLAGISQASALVESKIEPGDSFIFFFSGHGAVEENGTESPLLYLSSVQA